MAALTDKIRAQIYLDVKDPDGLCLSQASAGNRHGCSKSTVGRIIRDFTDKNYSIEQIKAMLCDDLKPCVDSSVESTPKKKPKSNSKSKPKSKSKSVSASKEISADTESKKLTFVIGPTFVNLTDAFGKLHTVTSKSDKFNAVRSLVMAGSLQEAIDLIDTAKAIQKYTNGLISIDNGCIMYAGKDVSGPLGNKIKQSFESQDGKLTSLCNFLKRLMDNPSKNSIDLLWGFIEHNDISLSEDGCIIAWKKVTSVDGNLFDSYRKTIPNDLGTVVKMVRQQVVENPSLTCTHGLHVGAWEYVGSFSGDTILRVKIAPEDVVSVPTDYNAMKMRVSKYFVDAIVNRNREVLEEHIGAPTRIIRAGQNGEWEEEETPRW